MLAARRALPPVGQFRVAVPALVFLALTCLAGSLAIEIVGHLRTGLAPSENAYGALVYMGALLFGQLTFALVILGGFVIARHFKRRLDGERRVTFDNLKLLYHYTVLQSLFGLVLVHGFPRLVA